MRQVTDVSNRHVQRNPITGACATAVGVRYLKNTLGIDTDKRIIIEHNGLEKRGVKRNRASYTRRTLA